MSAFLGPIHYWLYNKIQIQQGLVEDITVLSQKESDFPIDLKTELDSRYNVSETRPLEEVIDQGNIHGWLQGQVSQAEYKLAYGVTALLEYNPQWIEEIKAIFENKGRENSLGAEKDISLGEEKDNAKMIYKAISDSLLDGMPCDHANSVLEEKEEAVVWKRNNCVHKKYWDEVGGDISNYYILREAFVKGFLSNTSMEYVKMDEVTSMIKRSDINEYY